MFLTDLKLFLIQLQY